MNDHSSAQTTIMTFQKVGPRTEGAPGFNPDEYFEALANGQKTRPTDNDLRSSIISTFKLPENDDYVYHASASVTLAQVQAAIDHGGGSGLHTWYMNEEGKPVRGAMQSFNSPKCLTI